MPIPDFLKPAVPLRTLSISARDTGGSAGASQVLPGFTVDRQLQDRWCWAAVSSSVANFFTPNAWAQCQVATQLKGTNCCDADAAGNPATCNVDDSLTSALTAVGCYSAMQWIAMSLDDVKSEIAKSRPVCCRIVWFEGGGSAHFVAIGGWSIVNADEYIIIHDPWYGLAYQKYTSFVAGYMKPGDVWSTSYWTKPAPAADA